MIHEDISCEDEICGHLAAHGWIHLWLSDVRAWRAAYDGQAETLDVVVHAALLRFAGRPPRWYRE